MKNIVKWIVPLLLAAVAAGCGTERRSALEAYRSWPKGLSVSLTMPADKLQQVKEAGFGHVEVTLNSLRGKSTEERRRTGARTPENGSASQRGTDRRLAARRSFREQREFDQRAGRGGPRYRRPAAGRGPAADLSLQHLGRNAGLVRAVGPFGRHLFRHQSFVAGDSRGFRPGRGRPHRQPPRVGLRCRG